MTWVLLAILVVLIVIAALLYDISGRAHQIWTRLVHDPEQFSGVSEMSIWVMLHDLCRSGRITAAGIDYLKSAEEARERNASFELRPELEKIQRDAALRSQKRDG